MTKHLRLTDSLTTLNGMVGSLNELTIPQTPETNTSLNLPDIQKDGFNTV